MPKRAGILPFMFALVPLLLPQELHAARKARQRVHAALTVQVVVVAPCDRGAPACTLAPKSERPQIRELTTPDGLHVRVIEY